MLNKTQTRKDQTIDQAQLNIQFNTLKSKFQSSTNGLRMCSKKLCNTDRGLYGEQSIQVRQIQHNQNKNRNIPRGLVQKQTAIKQFSVISDKKAYSKQNELLHFNKNNSMDFSGKKQSEKAIKTEIYSIEKNTKDLQQNTFKNSFFGATRISEVNKKKTIPMIDLTNIQPNKQKKQNQKISSFSILTEACHSAGVSPVLYNKKNCSHTKKCTHTKSVNRMHNNSFGCPINLQKASTQNTLNHRPFCANHRTQIATHYTTNQIQGQNSPTQSYSDIGLYFCGSCALMVATKGFQIHQIPTNCYGKQFANFSKHYAQPKIPRMPDFYQTKVHRTRSSNNISIKQKSSHKKFGKAVKLLQSAKQVINEKQKYSISTFENAQSEVQRQISQITLFFMDLQKFLQNRKQNLLQRLQNQKSQIMQLKSDIGQVFYTLRQGTRQLQNQLPNLLDNLDFDSLSEVNWRKRLQDIEKSVNEVKLDRFKISSNQLPDPKQICEIFDLILFQNSKHSGQIKNRHQQTRQQSTERSNNTYEEQALSQVNTDKFFPMICSLKVCSEYQVRQTNHSVFRQEKQKVKGNKINEGNKGNLRQKKHKREGQRVLMSIDKYDLKQGQSIEEDDSKSSSMNISGFLFEKGNESSCLLEFK